MGASSDVSGKTKATAKQYNDLRKDVVDTTSGHDHDGTDSKQVDHGGLGGRADDDHSQYWNDARGVTGVKTVKLDDLTAPDDNTDLNASTSKHGLLLKLDNTATHYLNGQGGWTTPTGLPTMVRKTADESVTDSVTLQNDDHLLLAMTANEVWTIEMVIILSCATADRNCKFAFALPVGATLFGWTFGVDISQTFGQSSFADTGEASMDAPTSTEIEWLVRATVANGENAGNLQFQWAQVTADANPTILRTNSCLIAHNLA